MSDDAVVESGAGYQLLLAAASVADPRWRLVFTAAPELAASWQRELGRGFVTELSSLGRLGWVNLAGLAIEHGAGADREAVLELVRGTDPVALHATLVGAGRRDLHEVLGADAGRLVAEAVQGDRAARTTVRRAVGDVRTRLEVHRWLWQAEPAEVHERCLDLLARIPEQDPEPDTGPMRSLVARGGVAGALAAVAPRLHYRPGSLGRVVLLASPAVDPVIVEIDLPGVTVIVHPPLRDAPDDAPGRLRRLARAAGDDVRVQILTELRTASRTLPDLVAALARPRTTLLHHLAMLRGAGLIDVDVPPRGPNSYRLDPTGFEDFATALRAFVGDDDS